MEPLLHNKKFINISIVFVVLLSLFTFAKFVNEVKSSDYIGRGDQPSVISVNGTGDVMATSDIATLSFTVSKEGDTAKAAQDALNVQLTKVLEYLKTTAIADKDIKSEYGGLNPKYGPATVINCFAYPCPQPESKIVGYTASQSITVKVRAVDTANDIRTALANLGVTNISGPTFSIDDQDALNNQARAKAIGDARAKANVLARELGVHLGKVVSFSDSSGGAYPIVYDKAMAVGSSAAPAPTLPKGENKITSNVTITYEIR